jgi:Rrf2 family protein
MKISYKCDYATKIILDLSENYPNNLVHIEDIARRQNIPRNYLEQILLSLKRGGFVQSKKGPKGGYSLTRRSKEISLGDVVRFIEGSIYPISCVDPQASRTCDEVSRCALSGVWKEVGDAISNIVDNVNFEQIMDRTRKIRRKEVINYYI